MKKYVFASMLLLVFWGVCAEMGFAEDMQGMEGDMPQNQGAGWEGQGQQGRGPGMMGMGQGMGRKMMGGMVQKDSLVATSDGGVILMQGPRLLKYDKDLNLIKEVEIPKGKRPSQQSQQNSQPPAEEVSAPVEDSPISSPEQ